MAASNITIRVEDEIKERFEAIVKQLGLNTTTAIHTFISAVVREERIPFEMALRRERSYDREYVASARKSMDQYARGELLSFASIEELDQFAKEKIQNAR